jgi:hypothetical protein
MNCDILSEILTFYGYGNNKKENIFLLRRVNTFWKNTINSMYIIPEFKDLNVQNFIIRKDGIKKNLQISIYDCIEYDDTNYFIKITNVNYEEYYRLILLKNKLFFEYSPLFLNTNIKFKHYW